MTQVFVKVWLILSITHLVKFTVSSPIERPGRFEQGQAQLDPCDDDDNKHYKTHPMDKNYSNEAEIGQELIDLLLRAGEIEEKSTIQSLDNETQHRKNDMSNIKSDRYDELLAAFNVILEEILRQGNSRLPNSDAHTYRDLANGLDQFQDDAVSEMDNVKFGAKCNRNQSDPMRRCLNPFEGELLRKIKALNHQLNLLMHKSNNNGMRKKRDVKEREFPSLYRHKPKEKDMFYSLPKSKPEESDEQMNSKEDESGDYLERKLKLYENQSEFVEYDNREKLKHPVEMPKSNEFFFARHPSPLWKLDDFRLFGMTTEAPEASPEEFFHDVKKREVSSSIHKEQEKKTEIETETVSANVLTKENNFGVELQKFIRYSEEESDNLESENLESPVNGATNESGSTNSTISNRTGEHSNISMKFDIQIPMRLVKKPDGRLYLVIDKRNSNRGRQCKGQPSK